MAQFPSTTSASDVWNVTDIYRAVAGGNWPSTPVADPYFPYVTMLLPGNGTNGAQNNTFLDSSASPLTITRAGNTTQGTFSPYGPNWSNYFDGTGDYLTTPDNAAWDLGSGAFTIESWVFPTASPAQPIIIGQWTSSYSWAMQLSNDGNRYLRALLYDGSFNDYVSSTSLQLNAWNHCAFVRESNTISLYLNGSRIYTTSYSGTVSTSSSVVSIGGDGSGSQPFQGYLSNTRVVVGTALYSGTTYTVPTAPLTAVSGTNLLTCQSNRFIDNSASPKAITANGNTSVQRFSPFSPTATYSTSVIGGSGYFDGTGDYLTTSGTGSFNPRSTFTVEFWTYPVTNDTVTWITSNADGFFYIETFTGTLYIGDGSFNTISTTPPALNRWTHVLLSFDGTTYRLFYNGVSQATSTSLLASNTISAFRIGQKNDGTRPFNGYINDMRVLVGTALYTSAFTPPTAPLAAISNTTMLLSYINAGIVDNAMMNNLETVGNAQISTAVSKFGGGSIAFDGTGDYLSIATNTALQFGTGNFTFECWVYRNSASGQIFIADFGVTSANGWALYDEGATGNMQVRIADVDRIAVSPIPATTWTHLAVVRVGTTITLYVNGTAAGSYASAGTNLIYAGTNYIGSYIGSSSYINGYMDDIRVTKGYARYTANFTAPTAAFVTF
jgi:hypothetical protein